MTVVISHYKSNQYCVHNSVIAEISKNMVSPFFLVALYTAANMVQREQEDVQADIGSVDHFGYLWPQKMPEVGSLWLQK